MNQDISFEKRDVYTYPDSKDFFNPSIKYPEYKWSNSDISSCKNEIYDMVRQNFINLEMDREHIGTTEWNPFKDIIKPGNKVLLKPNMVVSQHPQIDCIVTNPSVLRAVLDYVCIALDGIGEITIGDAPMQRCNFDDLVHALHYDRLQEFYGQKGISIKFFDFRNFVADYSSTDVKITRNQKDVNSFICVDLGKDSLLCETDKYYKRYRVTNYDYHHMWEYHNKEHHKYLIRKDILEADVIINLPKCKTHKKAGLTAALKNYVGTVVHKECLPHHIKGSVMSGGNEYLNRSVFKALRTFFQERIDLANIYDKKSLLPIYTRGLNLSQKMVSRFQKDCFSEGSWYGNDTIWRTFCDINRIIMYADKNGSLHDTVQRRTFAIGDMIYTGDHEGPVHATPKNCGIIVAGYNPVAFDCLVAKIMGFNYKKIPATKNIFDLKKYPLTDCEYNDITVKKQGKRISLSDLEFNNPFVAASGWMNYIEEQ